MQAFVFSAHPTNASEECGGKTLWPVYNYAHPLCLSMIDSNNLFCGIRPDEIVFASDVHKRVLGPMTPSPAGSLTWDHYLVSISHCIPGTSQKACCFGDHLTQSSNHHNLALVKVTPLLILMLANCPHLCIICCLIHPNPWQVPL